MKAKTKESSLNLPKKERKRERKTELFNIMVIPFSFVVFWLMKIMMAKLALMTSLPGVHPVGRFEPRPNVGSGGGHFSRLYHLCGSVNLGFPCWFGGFPTGSFTLKWQVVFECEKMWFFGGGHLEFKWSRDHQICGFWKSNSLILKKTISNKSNYGLIT